MTDNKPTHDPRRNVGDTAPERTPEKPGNSTGSDPHRGAPKAK